MEEKERELHAIRLDNEAVSLRFYYVFSDPDVYFVDLNHLICFAGLGQRGSIEGTKQRAPELQVLLCFTTFLLLGY